MSRIKIMSQLDITERRKPQDGKIEFRRFGPLDVDLRVATIPTSGGLEDVVMRVLGAATPVPIDAARLRPEQTLERRKAPDLAAARPVPGLRADRLGQDHDAPFAARAPEHGATARSGRPRTRSRSRSPGCARCRSTRRSAGPSPPRCAASCAPIPTSSWWARCATPRPRRSASRPRSPGTWCSRRCTPTARRKA